MAQAELADFLRGTFLEGAPILPISNVTGEGFDAFFEALDAPVRSIRPKRDRRHLPPAGRAGLLGRRATARWWPASRSPARPARATKSCSCRRASTGRIRRIEVYGRPSDTVMAGQCAALNVGRWDHHAIRRGDTLAVPGYFSAEEWYAATLRLLPRPKLHLKNGARGPVPHGHVGGHGRRLLRCEADRMHGGNDYLVQIRTQDAGRGRAGRPLHPAHALAGADHRRRHDRRGRCRGG